MLHGIFRQSTYGGWSREEASVGPGLWGQEVWNCIWIESLSPRSLRPSQAAVRALGFGEWIE